MALSRREFMVGIAAGAAAAGCARVGGPGLGTGGGRPRTPNPEDIPVLAGEPFTLGVASGDPTPDSVILWTRLAPRPVEGGGMPAEPVPVRWQVATDAAFTDLVADGLVDADPAYGHSVHVDVRHLRPATAYHYRFTTGPWTSPVGRTRTAPRKRAHVDRLHFVFASCQNWQAGHYPAWRHAAAEQPDLVVFLGDYIYEGGVSSGGVRRHDGPEPTTLTGYRNRYGLYKGDADLRAAHAAAPWVVTWDDHEVENNYAAGLPQDGADPAEFVARRAAAYQAYYEHMPIRVPLPVDDSLELYRGVEWGRLARFFVLDTRQFRSDQACGTEDLGPDCPERSDPERTILGAEQEAWLVDGFRRSKASWNVLANQVIMSATPLAGLFNMDQWDGYAAQRARILQAMVDHELSNPVVVTGDIHASGVGDLVGEVGDQPVGTEFVGTSISSTFTPDLIDLAEAVIGGLPHVRWFDARHRGYVSCEVTPDAFRASYRIVDALQPDSPVTTARTWVVDAGSPGARPA